MKVLSLLQPWASLLITDHPRSVLIGPDGANNHGIKKWETRPWRPVDKKLIAELQTEGFLIHASAAFKTNQQLLASKWPFSEYLDALPDPLPLGKIIGHVKLGEIITTEQWVSRFNKSETEGMQEEYQFGDYSPGRFAWEILTPLKFPQPIPVKGNLGLWNYDLALKNILNR